MFGKAPRQTIFDIAAAKAALTSFHSTEIKGVPAAAQRNHHNVQRQIESTQSSTGLLSTPRRNSVPSWTSKQLATSEQQIRERDLIIVHLRKERNAAVRRARTLFDAYERLRRLSVRSLPSEKLPENISKQIDDALQDDENNSVEAESETSDTDMANIIDRLNAELATEKDRHILVNASKSALAEAERCGKLLIQVAQGLEALGNSPRQHNHRYDECRTKLEESITSIMLRIKGDLCSKCSERETSTENENQLPVEDVVVEQIQYKGGCSSDFQERQKNSMTLHHVAQVSDRETRIPAEGEATAEGEGGPNVLVEDGLLAKQRGQGSLQQRKDATADHHACAADDVGGTAHPDLPERVAHKPEENAVSNLDQEVNAANCSEIPENRSTSTRCSLEKNDRISQLEEEVDTLSREKSLLAASLNNAQNLLVAAEQNNRKMERDTEQLRKTLDERCREHVSEIDVLRMELASAELVNLAMSKQVTNLQDEITAWAQVKHSLEDRLQAETEASSKMRETLESELRRANAQIRQLVEQFQGEKERCKQKLRKCSESLKSDRRQLQCAMQLFEAQLDSAESN